jgi:hypothetical protein
MTEKTKKFIQKIVSHEEKFEHKGMTHDLLSVPREFNLSKIKKLLVKIVKSPIDTIIDNPTNIGKSQYQVTKELKQHVNAALNLINISQKYHNKKRNKLE